MKFWKSTSGPKDAQRPLPPAATAGEGGAGAGTPDEPRCAFCGRGQSEVRRLVAGDAACICDGCVALCADVVREHEPLEPFVPELPLAAITARLDAEVVGQAAAKRALGVALWLHLRAFAREHAPPGPRRVLLVGPRGAGKTSLLRAAARVEGRVPSYLAAASRLTETGYVGENVEHLLLGLLRAAGREDAAQRGLLALDALHHLAARRPPASAPRDISGAEVQRELVRLLEGQVTEVPGGPSKHPERPTTPFACDRLLFLATATAPVGGSPGDPETLRGRLVDAGLSDELLSRFDLIVPVPALSEDELIAVVEREALPVRQLLAELGASLTLTPDGARHLAARAAASRGGAWSLRGPFARLVEAAVSDPRSQWVVDAALAARLGG